MAKGKAVKADKVPLKESEKKKKVVKIDSTKVADAQDGGHRVKYSIYHEKGDNIKVMTDAELKKKNIAIKKNICYAGLKNEVKPKHNRLMYFIQKEHMPEGLPMIKRIAWIKLAVRNKLLPKYILKQNLEGDRFVIKIDNISPSLLYVYLSTIRNVQENPRFVKNVLILHKTYKMDYASAFVVASKFNLRNSWHSIIGIGKDYTNSSNINQMKNIPVHIIRSLHLYMKNPEKHDKRAYPASSFAAADRITRVSRIKTHYCRIPDLFDPIVKKAIKAAKVKDAEELLAEASISKDHMN